MDYFASSTIDPEFSARVAEAAAGILMLFPFVVVMILIIRVFTRHYLRRHKARVISTEARMFHGVERDSMKILNSTNEYFSIISVFRLNRRINCSSSVVSNAKTDPLKYTLKYSEIPKSVEGIAQLEFLEDIVCTYESLSSAWGNIGHTYKKSAIPLFLKPFISREKVTEILCDNYIELKDFKLPYLIFSYVSPAGRSSRACRVELSSGSLKEIVQEISGHISKTGHAKRQRSAMSADLREAIKRRDNYTCQICGNSVLNEPNLLLEVDHIIPIAEGGETRSDNLQTLCWRCNRAKGKKTTSDK